MKMQDASGLGFPTGTQSPGLEPAGGSGAGAQRGFREGVADRPPLSCCLPAGNLVTDGASQENFQRGTSLLSGVPADRDR